MCGLNGLLSLDLERLKVTEMVLLAICDTVVNRGPNGASLWLYIDGPAGLAHRLR